MRYCYTLIFIFFFAADALAQHTILWKVEAPDGAKVSYILGTYHQMGNSFVDSIPIIEKSLLASELIVFESIDSKEVLIKKMNSRACTNEIADVLNKKELKTLRELSKDWKVDICKLSLSEIYVKLYQEVPKYICNTIQDTDNWHHFDNYLMHIASSNNKELEGLESTAFQLKTINEAKVSGDKKAKRKKIKKLLKLISNDKPDDELCAFANNYRNFRLDYHLESECSDGIMLKGRNENWMKKLPSLLKQNNCFVAVGLAHLMMDCGLIEALRSEGFTIEPIVLNKSTD